MKVGNWVLAVGSPFGLEQTVTAGIVSAIRQSVHIENRTYKELIQTDAAINQGNSGGPLVNIEGKVIGINTAIYAPMGGFVGVGFAIPINRAKEILDDLIHKGKVIRGWLGVEIRPVDEAIAKHFGLKKKEGALVNKVFANTPAEKGGLKRGDVILEFDGKKVKDSLSLQDIVGRTSPNKKVKVKIVRNMKEKKLQIVTEEMPDASGEEEVIDSEESSPVEEEVSKAWLGMKVKTLTPLLIRRLGLSNDEKGVVIVEIEPGSIADEAGLLQGDCMRSINRIPVPNIKVFNQVIKKAKLSKGIVIDINRRGKLIYLSITE
jgi:serine protease Do